MLGKFVEKILHEDESELEEDVKRGIVKTDKKIRVTFKDLWLPILFFVVAAIPRLTFLFTHDPQNAGFGWYGDVYHHWQIAYLSGRIGFHEGFLRLWDLKGMEFFWGLGHPLVLNILFWLTNSIDILVPRLLSVFCGSLVVSFLFVLVRRYFNERTAFLVASWAALFSVSLFSDSLGMQEQLGLVFLFGGILAWPKKPTVTGLLWAFASTVRSEYWLFSLGLLFVSLILPSKKDSGKKMALSISYIVPIIFYMKYLMDYTGNAIYPIYWNFLASVIGKWFSNVHEAFTAEQNVARLIGKGIFGFGIVGGIFTFIKRPKYIQMFLLGFANITFIGFIFGFAAYAHGFFDRFWIDRLFAFPYMFTGILLIIFVAEWLPKILGKGHKAFYGASALLTVGLIILSQIAWGKINHYFSQAQASYKTEYQVAKTLSAGISKGGKILFPADRPLLTYILVRDYKLDGVKIVSQMYDPYFYAKEEEPKADLDIKMINWLESQNVKYIVWTGKSEYQDLFNNYQSNFQKLKEDSGTTLYEFLQ